MSNEDIERAAGAVAGPISIHIDRMLSQLPEGTSLEEVASARLLRSEPGRTIQNLFGF